MSWTKQIGKSLLHLVPGRIRRKLRHGAYLLVKEDLEARLAPYDELGDVLRRIAELENAVRAESGMHGRVDELDSALRGECGVQRRVDELEVGMRGESGLQRRVDELEIGVRGGSGLQRRVDELEVGMRGESGLQRRVDELEIGMRGESGLQRRVDELEIGVRGESGLQRRVDELEIRFRTIRGDLAKVVRLKKLLSLHSINRDSVLSDILLCDNVGVTGKDEPGGVVVSLTSYPARLYDLHFTLHSLLSQSFKPEKVVLWLGEDKLSNGRAGIPKVILDMEKRGLEIRFCKDVRSFTKLLPSLAAFPDKTIVTADDDIFYAEDWLERLVSAHRSDPSAIWAVRAYKMDAFPDDEVCFSNYKKWPMIMEGASPSFCNFLTGVGGVLYPAGALHEDVSKNEIFQEVSPLNDDIWFWAMAVHNGTKIGVLPDFPGYLTYTNAQRELGMNGDGTLADQNVRDGKNDEQLNAVYERYPDVQKALNDVIESRRSLHVELASEIRRSIAEMADLDDSDPVRVVFITDGKYIKATLVAISSLLRHRRADTKVEINVIGVGLSDEERALFAVFGSAVSVLSVENKYDGQFMKHQHVSEAALLKFDLPALFPNYAKLLYLDGDLLIFDDLKQLWDTPLEQCYAAVIKDYAAYLNGAHNQRIGHKDYFNSGVMLLNLELFRKVGMTSRLMDAKINDPVPGAFMDQTAFNLAFEENVKYVSPKFNMMRSNNKRWAPSIAHISSFYGFSEKEFEEISKNPAILHLTNKLKPWSSKSAPSWAQWQDEADIFRALEGLVSQEASCGTSHT